MRSSGHRDPSTVHGPGAASSVPCSLGAHLALPALLCVRLHPSVQAEPAATSQGARCLCSGAGRQLGASAAAGLGASQGEAWRWARIQPRVPPPRWSQPSSLPVPKGWSSFAASEPHDLSSLGRACFDEAFVKITSPQSLKMHEEAQSAQLAAAALVRCVEQHKITPLQQARASSPSAAWFGPSQTQQRREVIPRGAAPTPPNPKLREEEARQASP